MPQHSLRGWSDESILGKAMQPGVRKGSSASTASRHPLFEGLFPQVLAHCLRSDRDGGPWAHSEGLAGKKAEH